MGSAKNLFAVGDADFEAKVLKADRPVIVDFWADWCPPCRAIAPLYERLSGEYAGKMGFAKIDIDQHPLTPSRFGVLGFPTFLVFQNGKVSDRVIGFNPSGLRRVIERVLSESHAASRASAESPADLPGEEAPPRSLEHMSFPWHT